MDRTDHVFTKLTRAGEHLGVLLDEMQAFHSRSPFRTYREKSWGFTWVFAQFAETPPLRWAAIIGDVVHNLRSSLDILICQLVESNGGIPNDDTRFPMTKGGAASYRSLVKSATRGVSADARVVLTGLEPFPGGKDEDLYALHRLDIEDKHHLLVPMGGAARDMLQMGPGFYHVGSEELGEFRFPLEDGGLVACCDPTVENPDSILDLCAWWYYVAIRNPVTGKPRDVYQFLNEDLGVATQRVVNLLLPYLENA
jgi:hypothetical protein